MNTIKCELFHILAGQILFICDNNFLTRTEQVLVKSYG